MPGLSKDYAKKRAELKKQYKLHTENARIQKIKELGKNQQNMDQETPLPVYDDLLKTIKAPKSPKESKNVPISDDSLPPLKMPKKKKSSFEIQNKFSNSEHEQSGSMEIS